MRMNFYPNGPKTVWYVVYEEWLVKSILGMVMNKIVAVLKW